MAFARVLQRGMGFCAESIYNAGLYLRNNNAREAACAHLADMTRTITALEPQARRRQRVNVYLDGAFAFALATGIAMEAGLAVGQRLSPQREAELCAADELASARDAALRLLGYRPRSEAELRRRLLHKRIPLDLVARVIDGLRAEGLVDDEVFARYWRENRDAFRPRSRRALAVELRLKGVPREVVEEATADIDEEANAYRTALAVAGRLASADYDAFRQKLAAHLRRRGFGWEVARRTVERLWAEARPDASDDDAP